MKKREKPEKKRGKGEPERTKKRGKEEPERTRGKEPRGRLLNVQSVRKKRLSVRQRNGRRSNKI